MRFCRFWALPAFPPINFSFLFICLMMLYVVFLIVFHLDFGFSFFQKRGTTTFCGLGQHGHSRFNPLKCGDSAVMDAETWQDLTKAKWCQTMGFDLGKNMEKQWKNKKTKGQGIQLIGYWFKEKLKIPENPWKSPIFHHRKLVQPPIFHQMPGMDWVSPPFCLWMSSSFASSALSAEAPGPPGPPGPPPRPPADVGAFRGSISMRLYRFMLYHQKIIPSLWLLWLLRILKIPHTHTPNILSKNNAARLWIGECVLILQGLYRQCGAPLKGIQAKHPSSGIWYKVGTPS